MEQYREEIEKEAAEANGYLPYARDTKGIAFNEGFIEGVNSPISERIRIQYAIDVLEELMNGVKGYGDITKKINELKQQLNGK